MQHCIQVGTEETTVRYGDCAKGTLFRLLNRVHDQNVYMKIGTKSFSLKTGEEYSNDQEREVVPLPQGTSITIIVGH